VVWKCRLGYAAGANRGKMRATGGTRSRSFDSLRFASVAQGGRFVFDKKLSHTRDQVNSSAGGSPGWIYTGLDWDASALSVDSY